MDTKSKVIVFDNEGKTFDRYTIINLGTGEFFGASKNPFDPQGFGQFCGTTIESVHTKESNQLFSIELGWWKKALVKSSNKQFISEAKKDGRLGKIVDFDSLPEDVQKYCRDIVFEPAN